MVLPEGVDERLWIKPGLCGDRDFLAGNSHTFPGLMAAYCPHLHQGFSVSLDDIDEMAEESALWVRGFLIGNEPVPVTMFGPAIHEADESDPRWRRWSAAVAQFREAGRWAPAPWRELFPPPPEVEGAVRPWTMIGDVYWGWDGHEWTPSELPPGDGGTLLTGTVCHTRRHHEMTKVTEDHTICDDCGWVS